MERIIKRPPPSGLQWAEIGELPVGTISITGTPPPPASIACVPPAARPENPTLCPNTLRPCSSRTPQVPGLGLPLLHR